MMIVSAVWSPIVSEVSGPGLEPSCLGTAGVNGGVFIGCDAVDASIVANTVVGARLTPTMGTMLSGKMLESMGLFNNN